jgi:competence protein ComEA
MKKLSVRELQIIGSVTLLLLISFVAIASHSSQDKVASVQEASKPVVFPLDLNCCSEKELQMLPGIGPSKAKAIIEYRNDNGYFRSVKELLAVKGIGEKTLANLEELVKVDSEQETSSLQYRAIDINKASVEELTGIKGVGIAKAVAIVEYRESHGPFVFEGDLLEVPGIGPANLTEIVLEIAPLQKEKKTSTRLSINNSTQKELESLPGIGPVLASRIIDYRNEKGRITCMDELLQVKGIGEKIAERIGELIEF